MEAGTLERRKSLRIVIKLFSSFNTSDVYSERGSERARVSVCSFHNITTVKNYDLAQRACNVLEARSRGCVAFPSTADHGSAYLIPFLTGSFLAVTGFRGDMSGLETSARRV